ncbi:MAG: type II toxin-antitoxin system RelE/ParE family toxin [Deltaproteobacteria bacterium]|nr:type II toxin-antitoxin system RelE/ParE family toxin [Deltaproteobacteria bacterium]
MTGRRRVERRPRARLDVLQQATYLTEEASEEVALRFVQAVDSAFRRLADTPEAGRLREFRSIRLTDLRS